MLTDIQKRRLRRLVHLCEFAPCPTTPYDYELEQKGYVKITKETFRGKEYTASEITHYGVQHANHLSEENKLEV